MTQGVQVGHNEKDINMLNTMISHEGVGSRYFDFAGRVRTNKGGFQYHMGRKVLPKDERVRPSKSGTCPKTGLSCIETRQAGICLILGQKCLEIGHSTLAWELLTITRLEKPRAKQFSGSGKDKREVASQKLRYFAQS